MSPWFPNEYGFGWYPAIDHRKVFSFTFPSAYINILSAALISVLDDAFPFLSFIFFYLRNAFNISMELWLSENM